MSHGQQTISILMLIWTRFRIREVLTELLPLKDISNNYCKILEIAVWLYCSTLHALSREWDSKEVSGGFFFTMHCSQRNSSMTVNASFCPHLFCISARVPRHQLLPSPRGCATSVSILRDSHAIRHVLSCPSHAAFSRHATRCGAGWICGACLNGDKLRICVSVINSRVRVRVRVRVRIRVCLLFQLPWRK